MKNFLFLLVAGLLFSSGAYAEHHCGCDKCDYKLEQKMRKKGGFEEQKSALMSVKDILECGDGTYVSAKGYLRGQLNDDEYSFTDGTGNIRVKIKDKIWRGQWVKPEDEIFIYGKTDSDSGRVIIKVKKLRLVK